MAQTIKWTTPAAIVSYLTTELNALANAAQVLGAAIDNLTGLNLYMTLELYVGVQTARSAGAYVAVYLLPCIDGTNYSYGDATTDPSPTNLVATLALDAAVTARYVVSQPIALPPHSFKILAENQTGQAFAATTNTLKYQLYNVQAV